MIADGLYVPDSRFGGRLAILPPFNQEELALLARQEFLHPSAANADLVEALLQTTDEASDDLGAPNRLGDLNEQLILALEQFIETGPSETDARTAQQLSIKLRGALAAGERP